MQTVSGTKGVGANGHDGNGGYAAEKSTWATKKGLAQMLKGGVIMDVVTPEQAQIAEDAGAVAVMALERVPSDIRKDGGVATPADAALVMQLGAEGVFVGSGIFKSANPSKTAKAIVQATTNYRDAALIAEVSKGLGDPMKGIEIGTIAEGNLLATRGW